MLPAPVAIAAPAAPAVPNPFDCLSPGTAGQGRERVEALMSEAKAYPLKVLEPGDDLLPASMPDTFKPQLVVMDAELDSAGRVSTCTVRQRSTFQVLNDASCGLVRRHYVALQPGSTNVQKIAVNWTSRTTDPQRRACSERNGTIPVASSLWATSDVFKGFKPQNGAAYLALDVGTAGRADRCVVLASTLVEGLQRNLCRMVVQRAVVMPAADEQGRLVPARMTILVRLGSGR